MRTKSNISCSREGNEECCHSIKIPKHSCFPSKVSQHAALMDASTGDYENVASDGKMSFEGNGSNDKISCQNSSSGGSSLPPVSLAIAESILSPINDLKEANAAAGAAAGEDNEDRNSSSSNEGTHSLSDIHISDISMTDFSLDENTGLGDIHASYPYTEYQCIDNDVISDMNQRDMVLPCLEDAMDASYFHDEEIIIEAPMSLDDSYIHLAFQHMRPSDQLAEIECNAGEPHAADGFDPYLFIRNLPDLSEVAPSIWPDLLPKESQERKSVTLVLDLDETLVHSSLEYCEAADFTFPIYFNMREHIVYVQQRPHLHMFLERVSEMFEVIVFTASQSIYAEKLLNILDPKGKFISRRVYRESCTISGGNYVKDLKVLGLNLAKVAIIDNSPQVFQLQVNNGIPIESWFDDPSDCALISLLPFLETLVDVDDVRPIIAQRFNNN